MHAATHVVAPWNRQIGRGTTAKRPLEGYLPLPWALGVECRCFQTGIKTSYATASRILSNAKQTGLLSPLPTCPVDRKIARGPRQIGLRTVDASQDFVSQRPGESVLHQIRRSVATYSLAETAKQPRAFGITCPCGPSLHWAGIRGGLFFPVQMPR